MKVKKVKLTHKDGKAKARDIFINNKVLTNDDGDVGPRATKSFDKRTALLGKKSLFSHKGLGGNLKMDAHDIIK